MRHHTCAGTERAGMALLTAVCFLVYMKVVHQQESREGQRSRTQRAGTTVSSHPSALCAGTRVVAHGVAFTAFINAIWQHYITLKLTLNTNLRCFHVNGRT